MAGLVTCLCGLQLTAEQPVLMRFQLLYWPAKNTLRRIQIMAANRPFREQSRAFRLAAAGFQPLVGVRIDGRLAGCPALRTMPSEFICQRIIWQKQDIRPTAQQIDRDLSTVLQANAGGPIVKLCDKLF